MLTQKQKDLKRLHSTTLQCLCCGSLIVPKKIRDLSRKKFCSNKCRLLWLHTDQDINRKRSETDTGKPHPHKGNKKGNKKGHKITLKTRIKISQSLRGRFCGPDSHNWKGGVSYVSATDKRRDSRYIRWRTDVFMRDNYTCCICEKKNQQHGGLNAHHVLSYIKHISTRYDVDNGITLCVPCHLALHKAERAKKTA